jgi:beta-glucanase (GH16 family)
MNKKLLIALFYIPLISFACSKNSTEPEDKDSSGWQLVWSDEFNYEGLPDSTKWGYDVGGNGWGNNELQYYTNARKENAQVTDSFLVISSLKENYQGSNYTSARLVSTNKGDWTYGRFEIRAWLPKGRGTWPALWMLPTEWTYGDGGWPDNGEIDIMEHVGYDQGVIHASTHTRAYYWQINTQKTATIKIPDCSSAFHVYAMEWYPDSINIFVDEIKYFTFKKESDDYKVWPFNKDFHFIFNIAIGGDWGGQQGVDDSIFPQRMFIDFVRVYKRQE